MNNQVKFEKRQFDKRFVAVIQFGPPCATDGFKLATYYQVTIDPEKLSPSGEYIRFGEYPGDEIQGWQKCSALTVVEVLASWPEGKEMPELRFAPKEIANAEFMVIVE